MKLITIISEHREPLLYPACIQDSHCVRNEAEFSELQQPEEKGVVPVREVFKEDFKRRIIEPFEKQMRNYYLAN